MGEWLILVLTNCFCVFVGWCFAQRYVTRVEMQNLRQQATIIHMTKEYTNIQTELKLLKECRFYGGEPPPRVMAGAKPSVFGSMLHYPQLNQKITPPVKIWSTWWAADYTRAIAATIL